MIDVVEKNQQHLEAYTQTSHSAETGAAWIYPVRREAAARFAQVGFPSRKDEDWRYTNIAPIVGTPFTLAANTDVTSDEISQWSFAGLDGTQLTFINGRFSAEHSKVDTASNVKFGSIAEAVRSNPALLEPHLAHYAPVESNPFVALNTAALDDGAYVIIPANVVETNPIHLLFYSAPGTTPTVSHPRVLIIAEPSSQSTIVESYCGDSGGQYFTNAVTEVIVEGNANIDHYKLQREAKSAFHVATMQVQMGHNSTFSSHSISLGGSIVRNDANAALLASGCECTLNGLYTARENQIMDNHTSIDHAMPHCNSHEIYKGILDGNSRGIFNGKIFVREDAQKTDAKQTNQTLLLSDGAQINTKPQLEIYADDVKCTHGATVGQLSAEALFYLRSRGIPMAQAQSLLTYAFASDIVSRIKVDAVREALDLVLLAERNLEGV